MEKKICAQLFEIANENMERSGNAFVHSKAAFLYYPDNDPHAVDVLQLMEIEGTNEDFLEIAYIAILNRPVDADALKHWQRQFSLPQKQFRALVIRRLTTSPEADVCHKRIYNNIYLPQRRKRGREATNAVVQKLMPVYRKLPTGMKSVIRKIAGVNQA